MSRSLSLSLLVALLSLAGPVIAQDRLQSGHGYVIPSDNELKAAYCVSVNSRNRSELASAIQAMESRRSSYAETGVDIDKVILDSKSLLAKFDERLERLSSFLTPRQPLLEPSSLLAAMSRGEADLSTSSAASSACRTSCESSDSPTQCTVTCAGKNEAYQRVAKCNDLSFLPY